MSCLAECTNPEDFPLAVLVQQGRLRRVKGEKKIADPCKSSPQGRPNPPPSCGNDEKGSVFTVEMLQRLPWAKVLATGPEGPLHIRHQLFSMICQYNVSMLARGNYENKRHYQNPNHLRQDKRY